MHFKCCCLYFLVCKPQTKHRDPKFPFEEHSPAFKLSRSYKLSLSRYILPSKYLPSAARECTQDQRSIRPSSIRKEAFTLLNEEIKILESGMKRLPSYERVLNLRRLMSYIYMKHPFLMFLDHTQRRSTVGRTPLDE